MRKVFVAAVSKIENSLLADSIRRGLIMVIPVLMIGSFALIAKSFPLGVYQTFIEEFCDGILFNVFNFVYNATFGLLSLFMTIAISISYTSKMDEKLSFLYGPVFTSMICFGILSGVLSGSFNISTFGVKGMFTAIFSSILASFLYVKISEIFKLKGKLFADGADLDFNNSLCAIIPGAIVAVIFALLNYIIIKFTGATSFQNMFIKSMLWIFSGMGRSFFCGLLYVFISSLLWFFGIHGSDVLEEVNTQIFTPALDINAKLVLSGGAASEILTKPFFDCFVLIGGCATALCLLISILVFSKRPSNRSLAKMSFFPMLFNINELMIFGLPVVLNPVFFIPLLLVPIVSYIIAYLAMYTGLVPLTTVLVQWTTPIGFGGYLSTGSVRGILLQFLIVAVGVFIYKPFVMMYDEERDKMAKRRIEGLISTLKDSEISHASIVLTEIKGELGMVSKNLVCDLGKMIKEKSFEMYYQPQYDNKDRLFGAEALLRWNHPQFGMMYPPLIIKIAQEGGVLFDLEKAVVARVCDDLELIKKTYKNELKISVNVSAETIQSTAFEQFLKGLLANEKIKKGDICLEVTEQMAISSKIDTIKLFRHIRQMGYPMAIDDFSMGFTSLKYLQECNFNIVKLDGALVKGMRENERSKDIIKSIIYLSDSLKFTVLAEYVETLEQKKDLEAIGCLKYQGYLYSKPISLKDLIKLK